MAAADLSGDTPLAPVARAAGDGPQLAIQRLVTHAFRRLGWGVADQAVSSLSNVAVSIYVVHSLGAAQFGAFSLAYVTYGFALNASRGLCTDPLMVRFSGVSVRAWRRGVRSCTGTACAVGLFTGIGTLAAAVLFGGTIGAAFLGLGLTLPGLMLQDSWRFSFFAAGRGGQAFLNDSIWAVTLIPALVLLRVFHHADVFWFTFAWGATACIGAVAGVLQAGLFPRPTYAWDWLTRHHDLGTRYLLEGTLSSAVMQVRGYGTAALLGLAAVGFVQASVTLTGPMTILFLGMGLVTLPEGARILHRSPRHFPTFCVLVSGGLSLAGLAWGIVLIVAVPKGLGQVAVGSIWRPTYPLMLPQTVYLVASGVAAGAGTGLHALGAARRSLRVVIIGTVVASGLALGGAAVLGAPGTIYGMAVGTWLGAILGWAELRKAWQEWKRTRAMADEADIAAGDERRPRRQAGTADRW
jgi:O-antigen/teichoic acid export membrane protein